jgi:DNA-binding MarR family transcriptional regulator
VATEPVQTDCVPTTLRMATRALARVYDGALAPAGLRTTHFSILARLEGEGPLSVGTLAARLAMDRTTLAREAKPLEAAGLIATRPGEDRRRRLLSLSPAGEAAVRAARPRWADAQTAVREAFGGERTDALLDELRALLGAAAPARAAALS